MFDQLTDIIVNYVEVKKEDIKPESRFIEDLGFTSFDFMSMLGEVEDVELSAPPTACLPGTCLDDTGLSF